MSGKEVDKFDIDSALKAMNDLRQLNIADAVGRGYRHEEGYRLLAIVKNENPNTLPTEFGGFPVLVERV